MLAWKFFEHLIGKLAKQTSREHADVAGVIVCVVVL
jgi:hypothetical protein